MQIALTNKFQSMHGSITDAQQTLSEVRREAEEERQRELRACNIIIYNVPEPEDNNKTEREQTVTDFCLDMFSNLLKVNVSYTDVKKMMRLGKYSSTATAARPLLVQFRDRIIKNQIMESLSKLKGTNETYNKLIFAHDLTAREREDCKNLVADAKKAGRGRFFGGIHIQGERGTGKVCSGETPKVSQTSVKSEIYIKQEKIGTVNTVKKKIGKIFQYYIQMQTAS